jgi:hypothetical protein
MKAFIIAAAIVVIAIPAPVLAARSLATGESAGAVETVGTVVSSKPASLAVKTEDGKYVVFALDRNTQRPRTIPLGARVRVEMTDGDENEETPPRATTVRLMGTARNNDAQDGNRSSAQDGNRTNPSDGNRASGNTPSDTDDEQVPPTIRRAERDIETQARRYRAGVRAGVGLDPELISFGAHATLGPFFNPRLLFRPNVEFAYGELTTLFNINLEGVYRLSQLRARNNWLPYVGGGPVLGFSHRGLSTTTTVAGQGRSFSFSDFDFNGGLNLLAGFEKPNGPFIELKTSVYANPHLRLLFGFTF